MRIYVKKAPLAQRGLSCLIKVIFVQSRRVLNELIDFEQN